MREVDKDKEVNGKEGTVKEKKQCRRNEKRDQS